MCKMELESSPAPHRLSTPLQVLVALRVTAAQGHLRPEPPRRIPDMPASDSIHIWLLRRS